METETQPRKKYRIAKFLLCSVILLYMGLGYLFYVCVWQQKDVNTNFSQSMQKQIAESQKLCASQLTDVRQEVETQLKQFSEANEKKYQEKLDALQKVMHQDMQKEVAESRKIYVYNLEEVLRKANALETKKQFEDDIIKLNDELTEAEKKIETLKSAKVKEDFSDVYLNNLKMKRDDLVNNYEKNIDELTTKINKALNDIAQEKGVTAIFVYSAIAVNTENVIDLTDEIAERIK